MKYRQKGENIKAYRLRRWRRCVVAASEEGKIVIDFARDKAKQGQLEALPLIMSTIKYDEV